MNRNKTVEYTRSHGVALPMKPVREALDFATQENTQMLLSVELVKLTEARGVIRGPEENRSSRKPSQNWRISISSRAIRCLSFVRSA
ncbi:MAG: hypothetical protein ACYCTV_07760 [Leptospirales bacterium]